MAFQGLSGDYFTRKKAPFLGGPDFAYAMFPYCLRTHFYGQFRKKGL